MLGAALLANAALCWLSPAGLGAGRAATSLRRSSRPALVAIDRPASTAAYSPPLSDSNSSAWLDLWFPVCFSASIGPDSIEKATVFDRPLVLFR